MSDELAFDPTKCGLPAIPKLQPLIFNDCTVDPPVAVIAQPVDALITPTLGELPIASGTISINDFIGLGQATVDIPLGSTGLIRLFNCGVPTDNYLTVKARLNKVKSGDYVYYYKFGCGDEMFSSPTPPLLGTAVLTTALAPGSLTVPTSATATVYTQNNCVLGSAGTSITVYNRFASIRGNVGDIVEFTNMAVSGAPHYAVLNGNRVSGSSSGGTGTGEGCCSPCLDIDDLVLRNALYPSAYTVKTIPASLGGDANGQVTLVYIDDQTWESDWFTYTCQAGTDRYYWRLTTKPGSYNVAANCDDAPGSAILTLVRDTSDSLTCADLTSTANSRNSLSGTISYVYKNIHPFRFACGNSLYIGVDACMADALCDGLPCSVCVSPSSSLIITPLTCWQSYKISNNRTAPFKDTLIASVSGITWHLPFTEAQHGQCLQISDGDEFVLRWDSTTQQWSMRNRLLVYKCAPPISPSGPFNCEQGQACEFRLHVACQSSPPYCIIDTTYGTGTYYPKIAEASVLPQFVSTLHNSGKSLSVSNHNSWNANFTAILYCIHGPSNVVGKMATIVFNIRET